MSSRVLTRRENLKRALRNARRSKDGAQELGLEQLASIWGVTKARFVNVVGEIPDYPKPCRITSQGAHMFNAVEVLTALDAWEHRNDRADNDRKKRVQKLLGETGRGLKDDGPLFSANELVAYDRLAARAQEREIEQGNLLWAKDVRAKFGQVFSILSAHLGSLDNALDPNGLRTAEDRKLLKDDGARLLVKIHREIKESLEADD